MIDRSSAMVVELTSSWTLAKFRMGLARIKGPDAQTNNAAGRAFQLIVIVTSLEQAPPAARDLPIIVRPDVLSADPEPFIANVVDRLRPAATRRPLSGHTSLVAYLTPKSTAQR